MPLILRRKESSEEEEEAFYEHVTHAYVHGFMDGQVMNEDRDLEWINLV